MQLSLLISWRAVDSLFACLKSCTIIPKSLVSRKVDKDYMKEVLLEVLTLLGWRVWTHFGVILEELRVKYWLRITPSSYTVILGLIFGIWVTFVTHFVLCFLRCIFCRAPHPRKHNTRKRAKAQVEKHDKARQSTAKHDKAHRCTWHCLCPSILSILLWWNS